MNYLAHAYLSFDDPKVLIGNMISDFVKGRRKFNYEPRVYAGIMLHREIDSFTDDHPATKAARTIFQPYYRLYSGAFVDVVYDHFLAKDQNEFASGQLSGFAAHTYNILEAALSNTPPVFQQLFPYMKKYDWLFGYQFHDGIRKSFNGIKARANYIQETETAFRLFETHYHELSDAYARFFPELKAYALLRFNQL